MARVLSIACWITRDDPELALESKTRDQRTIISTATALVTCTVFAFVMWDALFSMFFPPLPSAGLALLMAAVLFQLDQAFSASTYELAGVLRTTPHGRDYYVKLLSRCSLTLVFSFCTGLAATIVYSKGATGDLMQKERTAANHKIEEEYRLLKASLSDRMAPLDTELGALQSQRESVRSQIAEHRTLVDEADQSEATSRIEAQREEDGLDHRDEGRGEKYRDALRLQAEAMRSAARAREEIARLSEDVKGIDEGIASLKTGRLNLGREIDDGIQALDAKKSRDPRWIPERDDPIKRIKALWKLRADPEEGPVLMWISGSIMLLLIIVELSFVLIRSVYAPSSVYMVRLIADIKADAVGVTAAYQRKMEEVHKRPRGRFRVVGGRDEEGEGP